VSPTNAGWRKSSYSSVGNCVELRKQDGLVQLRDSKNPDGAILEFSPHVFRWFIAGAKGGEFRSDRA